MPAVFLIDKDGQIVWAEFSESVDQLTESGTLLANLTLESESEPEVVVPFDAENKELPEGIAIDKEGNIYVSLGPPGFVGGGLGEIWKISPDGATTTLAQFDNDLPAAGLAVDASGNVYYAYPSGEEETQGVYRLTPDGDSERLPGTEAIIVANGIAFDDDGNLYVGDSILGIWRIPPGGSAELWLQHDLVSGCGEDDPFGANGVVPWKGKLYVANTGKGILVSVPILDDGTAGEPEMVAGVGDCDAEVKELYGMDGIALDVEGNVYAMLVMQNKLVKINPADGSFTTLLTEENGLHNPASVVFGIGEDDQSILFTNYAVLPPVPAASPGPAVLKLDVGVTGVPEIMPEFAETEAGTEVILSLDSRAGELPEGIALDQEGNVYVSMGYPDGMGGGFGQIRKVSPDGTQTVLVDFGSGSAPAGLALDGDGALYFAHADGVFRVTEGAEPERLPGTENIILANGLAFDSGGDLYASDSELGAVWLMAVGWEDEAEIWIQHDLLFGCDEYDPRGANGIAFWQDSMIVANTQRGILVTVPVMEDGSAGEPAILAGVDDCDDPLDDLDSLDGIALDEEGNVFALLVMKNKLVRIDPTDGSFETVLSAADGLFNPASITFGTVEGDRESVFFTNFALLPPEPPASLGPGVLKFDVGVQGAPMP